MSLEVLVDDWDKERLEGNIDITDILLCVEETHMSDLWMLSVTRCLGKSSVSCILGKQELHTMICDRPSI